uniref:Uncharacterized protein n=1 Tax=Catagonus wagneri TaxID=51154 RepID=A0A8C3VEL9_9CETA
MGRAGRLGLSCSPVVARLPHPAPPLVGSTPTCSWSLGQLHCLPTCSWVGPYPPAPPHPCPLVLKGRTKYHPPQGILGMPSCPRQRAAHLFSIYIKIVCILL